MFLSDFNDNLELIVTQDHFVFKNVNMFGYEFIDIKSKDDMGRIVESSLEKGFNLSLIPLTLLLLGNIMCLLGVRNFKPSKIEKF